MSLKNAKRFKRSCKNNLGEARNKKMHTACPTNTLTIPSIIPKKI
jgi:hypothetical protein